MAGTVTAAVADDGRRWECAGREDAHGEEMDVKEMEVGSRSEDMFCDTHPGHVQLVPGRNRYQHRQNALEATEFSDTHLFKTFNFTTHVSLFFANFSFSALAFRASLSCIVKRWTVATRCCDDGPPGCLEKPAAATNSLTTSRMFHSQHFEVEFTR